MSYPGQVRDGVTSVLGRCGSGRRANQARRSDHSDASVVQRCLRVGLCPQPLVTRAQYPRDGGFASAHEGAWPCGARPRAAPRYRREELRRASRLVDAPTADPHGGWWGGWGLETPATRLAICVRCPTTPRNGVLYEPLLQGRVHASLPTWPVGTEGRQYFGVEPNCNLLLRRISVLSSGLPQCTNR